MTDYSRYINKLASPKTLMSLSILLSALLVLTISSVTTMKYSGEDPTAGASTSSSATGVSLLRAGVAHSRTNNDFALAKADSLQFFDDIPSATWNRLKQKVKILREQVPFSYDDYRNKHSGFYFQYHNEPDFVCQHEFRIGSQGDGGKWVCDIHRINAQESCLVYSVGSRGDFSFEKSVLEEINPNCEIHTFDFGDFGKYADELGTHYHPWGFGTENIQRPFGQLKTMKETIEELGHQGRTIDIFKIDCDGCEYETVDSWFDADNVFMRQILVEVHSDPTVTPEHNNRMTRFFETLQRNDYVMFHKEPNIAHPLGSPVLAVEYCYLKLAPEFFSDFTSKVSPPAK